MTDEDESYESGRTPPFDMDAEAAVLSAVMIGGETGHESAIDHVIDILKAEHFYSEAHRQIYAAAVDLRGTGKPVDIVHVGGWLRDNNRVNQVGGIGYLAEVINAAPAIASVRSYAKRVVDKSRVRRMIGICQRIIATGYTDHGEVDAYLAQAEASVTEAAQAEVENGGEWIEDAVKRVAKTFINSMQSGGGITGVATGFTGLDRRMHGLQPGTVTVVAARPGMGKSAWSLNAAFNIAQSTGGVVPFFSLEMNNDEQASRVVASEASIAMSTISSGIAGPDTITRMIEVAKACRGVGVRLYDESSLTPQALGGKVRRLITEVKRSGRKVVAVVVDYLQLMKSARKNGSREQEVSDVSRGLKLLAKELKIPFVVLAQLNREGEKGTKPERPKLSNLRESGAIEQDADNILFIHREAYYTEQNRPTVDDVAELIIAKGRNIQKGTCRVKFDGTFTRFGTEEIEDR